MRKGEGAERGGGVASSMVDVDVDMMGVAMVNGDGSV